MSDQEYFERFKSLLYPNLWHLQLYTLGTYVGVRRYWRTTWPTKTRITVVALDRTGCRKVRTGYLQLISRVLRGAYPSVEAGSHGPSRIAMLGARELDLRVNTNGRLVRSEGEEDAQREYSHNVAVP